MPGPSKKISLTSLFYLTLKSSEQALQIFMENISDIDVVLGPEHAGHGRKKVHRGNDLNISRDQGHDGQRLFSQRSRQGGPGIRGKGLYL